MVSDHGVLYRWSGPLIQLPIPCGFVLGAFTYVISSTQLPNMTGTPPHPGGPSKCWPAPRPEASKGVTAHPLFAVPSSSVTLFEKTVALLRGEHFFVMDTLTQPGYSFHACNTCNTCNTWRFSGRALESIWTSVGSGTNVLDVLDMMLASGSKSDTFLNGCTVCT